MRSYASGTSSSPLGFVVDFGWLGFGKHPMKDQSILSLCHQINKRIKIIINMVCFGCIIGSRRIIII